MPHILCKIYSTNIFTYIVYITSTVDTVHVAYTIDILSKSTYTIYIHIFNIYIYVKYNIYIYCIYYFYILHIIYVYIYTPHIHSILHIVYPFNYRYICTICTIKTTYTMISMYTHQCCSRSALDIAGTLLALSYIFCV